MAELTRRDLFKAAGATAAVIGVAAVPGLASAQPRAAAQPPPGAWNHDPASPIGPLHWGTIGFPTCGTGTGQSPVNIRTDQVAAYHGPPLLLRYQQAELGIENTGHVVEVPDRRRQQERHPEQRASGSDPERRMDADRRAEHACSDRAQRPHAVVDDHEGAGDP